MTRYPYTIRCSKMGWTTHTVAATRATAEATAMWWDANCSLGGVHIVRGPSELLESP